MNPNNPTEELREDVKDLFEALGMAEPFDWDKCVEGYTDEVMKMIHQQATKAQKSILDGILMSNYDDLHNTYDYDGIAETALALKATLDKEGGE